MSYQFICCLLIVTVKFSKSAFNLPLLFFGVLFKISVVENSICTVFTCTRVDDKEVLGSPRARAHTPRLPVLSK